MRECRCGPAEIRRYVGKISGPLLDRMDMQVEMDAVSIGEIEAAGEQESSAQVQARVRKARLRQQERYKDEAYFCNAHLPQEGIERYCRMAPQAKALLAQAVERFHISMRTYARIRKVARTLADLADRDGIGAEDIAQAIRFRNLQGEVGR